MTEPIARCQPLVSVGVPIYNEERFLDQTLTSIRRQSHANIEIIICDNCSTDSSRAICERHAAEDARITVTASQKNDGATMNFRRVFDLAKGEYFMWAGAHDLYNENYVSSCLELLEQHPEACLAYGMTHWVDGQGEPLPRQSGWTDSRDLAAAARFSTLLWGNMHAIMGLIRTAKLRECRPPVAIVGGDLVLLADLILRGPFLHTHEAIWSRREFRQEFTHDDKVRRYLSNEAGVATARLSRVIPLLHLPFALMGTVLRSRRPWLEKLLILAAMGPVLLLRYRVGRQTRYS